MALYFDILLDGALVTNAVRRFRIDRKEDQAADVLTLELHDFSLYAQFDFGTLPASERIQIATANGTRKSDGSTVGTGVLTSASSNFTTQGVTTDDLIKIIESSVTADVGTWAVTAVGTTTVTSSHAFGTGTGIKFIILVNQGKFFAEKPDVLETDKHLAIPSLWGRNSMARLADPFAAKITKTWKEKTTFQDLVKALVKDNGMDDTKAQFDVSNYDIPANIFSVTDRFPLQVITDLAAKTNGYVRCKKDGNLWVKKRWSHFGSLAVAKSVGDADVGEQSTESVDYPEFGNRVLVRSAISAAGQDVQVQLRLETGCIRGDGVARAEATAIVTDGAGKPVANGTPVDFTIDDATLATFQAAQRSTGERSVVGEPVRASGLRTMSVSFPISKVVGVFLENDANKNDNFFTSGSFDARTITLGKDLPFSDSKVVVDYTAKGIAVGDLVSVANAAEKETEVHAAVGRVRDSATFCISNRRNVSVSLSAQPTEHNICVESPRTSQLVAVVKVDGLAGSGSMIQWLVEGGGSVSPAWSAVKNSLIAGEVVRSTNAFTVAVKHEIAGVTGVWVLSEGKKGTNYYSLQQDRPPAFAENVITLGTDLPADDSQVMVDYTARSVATAIYTARSTIGRDKVIAKINDGTSSKFESDVEIDTVNRCTQQGSTSEPLGGKKDCSNSVFSAQTCGATNPNDRGARVECICSSEGSAGGCPTTEDGCKSLCENLYGKHGLNPLDCEVKPTPQEIKQVEQVLKKLIPSIQGKAYVDCAKEADGDPKGIEECVAAHKDTTVERCTQTCQDHGLSISPTTAQMPCGQANPSISFTAKGKNTPFSWSATQGILIVASDSKSAVLKHDNPGSGVPGDAYTEYHYKCNQPDPLPCGLIIGLSPGFNVFTRSLGCNDQITGGCSNTENVARSGDCSAAGVVTPCGTIPIGTCATQGGACDNRVKLCDVRTPSMVSAGCRPCGIQFGLGTAKVRVTDSKGQSVEAAVTL